MAQFEPKQVQKELDEGWIWPVYWLFGEEQMKVRELVKRIRRAAQGATENASGADGGSPVSAASLGFGDEILDGGEVSAAAVLDSAQSLSLGGGVRIITVRDAHALKEPEVLEPLLTPRARREDLVSVCIFIAKDLDRRKKFSKTLLEKAAVVACTPVAEGDREAWIRFLAKRRGVEPTDAALARLTLLEPWSLDIIDQELQKFSIAGGAEDAFLQGAGEGPGTDYFLEAFFNRSLKGALEAVAGFADQPEEFLPLLGLLGWNVRHLALSHGGGGPRLSPFLQDRFRRWEKRWTLPELLDLQAELTRLDFSLKQTPKTSLGLWTELAMRFCQD